ncbi:MAG: GNAT family N-acetyltransferase [Micropruina sp.]|uniref:GNAT family N-acetyltransferase n=1 Tax=Micropruina sp. TaxID=2737536 RepID=UPI0039E44464
MPSDDYVELVIREALPEDFGAVMRLYRQLHPADPILDDGRDRDTFNAILDASGLTMLVLELGDLVVATTYLNVIPNVTRSASPYAVIENVVVDETMRGTGLGKQIMAATLQAAWDAGCYKAMLLTGSTNPATHAFYRRCGFSSDVKTAYIARPSQPDRSVSDTRPIDERRPPP